MIDRHRPFDRRLGTPAEAPIGRNELELLPAVALDRRVNLVEQFEELQGLARGKLLCRPAFALSGPFFESRHSLRVVVESNGQCRGILASGVALLHVVGRAGRIFPVRQEPVRSLSREAAGTRPKSGDARGAGTRRSLRSLWLARLPDAGDSTARSRAQARPPAAAHEGAGLKVLTGGKRS